VQEFGFMRHGWLIAALFFIASAAGAQEWHPFLDGAVFATYVTETGPKSPQNKAFSTNWFAAGAERDLGARGALFGRVRFSLEPFTIPKQGYPQLLQYIAPGSGGPLVDFMRAHDLVQEAVAGVQWRPLAFSVAPVGEPPIGPHPYAQRDSSVDFAEAPFAYDVQESYHVATRVLTAGLTSRVADFEYGVFHESTTTGRHTAIDDGSIDSWGARLTLAPSSRLSGQLSAGRLGDRKAKLTTASLSYNGALLAASGIWTRNDGRTAWSIEASLRAQRSVVSARAEWVDRPAGIFTPDARRTAHVTVGYVFEVLHAGGQRAGIGINADYHSAARELEPAYGHKPQNVYLFLRWRTDRSGHS